MLAIYEGKRLLSIPYCKRQIEKLQGRVILRNIMSTTSNDLEIKDLENSITGYKTAKEILESDPVSTEALIEFIANQIAEQIKNFGFNKAKIVFSYEPFNKHLVKIAVYNDLYEIIFLTEIAFEETVYDISFDLNRNYDGFPDTIMFIHQYTPTKFLIDNVVTVMKKLICEKLPNVKVEVQYTGEVL